MSTTERLIEAFKKLSVRQQWAMMDIIKILVQLKEDEEKEREAQKHA